MCEGEGEITAPPRRSPAQPGAEGTRPRGGGGACLAIAARGAEGRGAQGPSWRWGGSVSFAAPVPSGKWGLVTALPAGSPAPRLAASAVPLPALSPRSGGKKRAGGFLPAAWGDVCGEVSAI